jgi:integrase
VTGRSQPYEAADLTRHVEHAWRIEVEPFDPTITTCFGQAVEVIDLNGGWVPEISFEHVGCATVNLAWNRQFHENPFVEWIFRCCVVERMQTHIDVRPIFDLVRYLPRLAASPCEQNVAKKMADWASRLATYASLHARPHLAVGARAMCQWAMDLLLPGFLEEELDCRSYVRRNKGRLAVTFLDPNTGPFSASELSVIEDAPQRDGSWIKQRALFYLCKDWGLRPLQIALMRENDFGCDELGPYVMVPSVKGSRRSRRRRGSSNFKKRYVSDKAANAISAQISNNATYLNRAVETVGAHTGEPAELLHKLPRPLFAHAKPAAKARRYLGDRSLRPYTLHAESSTISREIRLLTHLLQLPAQRVYAAGQPDVLQISAYRFRHTKATAMVMSGHSPVDVAEALDHVTVGSVRYYFDFSRELIDFVNASHRSSAEIGEAVSLWSGRMTSRQLLVEPSDMRVAHLGICKAAGPCPHHPTVTCYTCPKFRPFKEGDHAGAEQAIQTLKAAMAIDATGPVRLQVDAALEGVRAVIRAIADDVR